MLHTPMDPVLWQPWREVFFFAGPGSHLVDLSGLCFSRLSSPWRPLKAVATECRSSLRVRHETVFLKLAES